MRETDAQAGSRASAPPPPTRGCRCGQQGAPPPRCRCRGRRPGWGRRAAGGVPTWVWWAWALSRRGAPRRVAAAEKSRRSASRSGHRGSALRMGGPAGQRPPRPPSLVGIPGGSAQSLLSQASGARVPGVLPGRVRRKAPSRRCSLQPRGVGFPGRGRPLPPSLFRFPRVTPAGGDSSLLRPSRPPPPQPVAAGDPLGKSPGRREGRSERTGCSGALGTPSSFQSPWVFWGAGGGVMVARQGCSGPSGSLLSSIHPSSPGREGELAHLVLHRLTPVWPSDVALTCHPK